MPALLWVYPVAVQVHKDTSLRPVAQSLRGDWVLLETADGDQGYAPLSFLDCTGLRCLLKVTPPPTPCPTRIAPEASEPPTVTITPTLTPTPTTVPM